MESLNQTAQPQENQPVNGASPNDSDFAQKGPLLTPKIKRKIILGTGVFIGLIILVVGGLVAYTQLTKPPELVQDPPKVDPVIKEPIISDTPKFAYIKNEKNIWISNINGEEKLSIIELPLTSQSKIGSLSWKDQENLGYSVCDTNTRVCEISTYNFATRAIRPELTTTGSIITKFAWSPDQRYLAYIEERENQTNLRLKVGTVDTLLKSFGAQADPSLSKTKIAFDENNQYVIFSAQRKDLPIAGRPEGPNNATRVYPVIYVYQVNGAQVDEIENATYPFFIDETSIAYKIGNRLVYKTVGTTEESEITEFTGYNPAISPNKRQIAYWRDEIGFNNVVLGVFENSTNIHRNILRGVILPVWVSEDKIVGIKADSCIGERCLLYEFQTASMVIVDVNNGEVISIDQGRTLGEIAFYQN